MKNKPGQSWRLFIALKLPAEVRGDLAALQEKLKQSEARVKWVKSEQLHLTLKFLGNVRPERVEDIARELQCLVDNRPPFSVEVADSGTFPHGCRARVVWAGIARGADTVCELAEAVEQGLVSHGFPAEKRRFRPHLTIGRIKSGKHIDRLFDLVKLNQGKKFGRFKVDEIFLIRSVLTPAGPEYTVIQNCPLGGASGAQAGGSGNSEVDDTHGQKKVQES